MIDLNNKNKTPGSNLTGYPGNKQTIQSNLHGIKTGEIKQELIKDHFLNISKNDLKIKRSNYKKQIIMTIFIICCLLLFFLFSFLFFSKKIGVFKLQSYEYSIVKKKDIVDSIQCSGLVNPSSIESVVLPEEGIIESIEVNVGDNVIKGQVLARLYSKKLSDEMISKKRDLTRKNQEKKNEFLFHSLSMEQNKNLMENYTSKYHKCEDDYGKYKRLYKSGAATNDELSNKENNLKEAEISLSDLNIKIKKEKAEYEIKIANLDFEINELEGKISALYDSLKGCIIKSSTNGKVMEILQKPGLYLTQYTGIMSIFDVTDPELRVNISETEILKIAVNQTVMILLGNKEYPGYVYNVDTRAKSGNNFLNSTVEVLIKFKEIPDKFIPGASANATIVTGIKKNSLYLPRGAFLATGEEHYIYKIENNKATRIEITFGIINIKEVEVLNGLKEGDKAIISGYQDYINFDTINLEPGKGTEID